MAEPKDRWDKAQIICGAIGAILVPVALLFWGQKYKEVEDKRATEQTKIENIRAEASADAQTRSAKAGVLTQLIDSLASQDTHKQELAFRAVEIVMPIEAPTILELVKSWQPGPTTSATPTTTAQTVDKVLDDAKKQAVISLFNPEDKTARGRAYNQITQSSWRTDVTLAEAILDAAEQRFSFERGIDNAVVALRDMSRQATQKNAAVRSRILAFADKVEKAYPGLEEDTKSLRKWISEDEKSSGVGR
jgi:hypothetical protein